ncbi:MAG: protein translocase subunit SecD [Candidatus Paceibacteria bacterium]
MGSKTDAKDTSPQVEAFIRIFRAVVVLALGVLIGYFVWYNATTPDAKFPFKLGLDLAGGSHLVYEADVSKIDPAEVPELMAVLRDVIERRINVFGVSEPIIQVEESSFAAEEKRHRLVVELPGVTDVEAAVTEIGRTPLLEFKLMNAEKVIAAEQAENLRRSASGTGAIIGNVSVNGESVDSLDPYTDTGLTGRYLASAALEFAGGQSGQLANEPLVAITFTDEGGKLFEEITRNNVGQQLAIFLDGEIISAPRINEAISGGRATISGGFTPDEARELAQNLNFGALPVPINLESTQTIGASLGAEVLEKGVTAGIVGLGIVILFMVLWYRVPGLIAGLALLLYVTIMLSLFMLIPVTLTAAGLAGFILSLGMAVDANVLVFERMKEEMRAGRSSRAGAEEGFRRAWSAIRDGNATSILSAIVLFWFGTSIVKGFALVFGIGVIVSMISAIVLTRTLLMALPDYQLSHSRFIRFVYGSGFNRSNN